MAEYDDRIVGHYAVLPMRMKYGRTNVWGGKAEGGIVDSAFRGAEGLRYLPPGETRTVYNILITRTLERARDDGIQLIWGFPNRVAVRGQVKAGYAVLSVPVSRFVLPVRVGPSLKQLARDARGMKHPLEGLESLADWTVRLLVRPEPITAPDAAIQIVDLAQGEGIDAEFWEGYDSETDGITISRNPEYIRWRFSTNPCLLHRVLALRRGGETAAYLAYAVRDQGRGREGRVVDMIARQKGVSDLRILLGQAVQSMQRQGVSFITGWFARNRNMTVYRDALRRQDFLQSSSPSIDVLVKTYDLPEALALDPGSWDLDMAFTEGTL